MDSHCSTEAAVDAPGRGGDGKAATANVLK